MHILPTFLDHPKTRRLIRSLGAPEAPLYLIRIWAFCQIEKTDRIGTAEDLEMIAQWDGEPLGLAKALEDTRWIERDGDIYTAHAFLEHNAKLLNLQQTAAIKKRWQKEADAKAKTEKPPKNDPVSHDADTPNLRRIYDVSPNEGNEGNEGREEHTPISPQASERKTIVSFETKPQQKKEGGGGKSGREERMRVIEMAAETGRWIGGLFGRRSPENLSSIMQARLHDHATRGLLPLEVDAMSAIATMHAIAQAPGASEDFELRVKWLKSAEALAEHLPEAADRALAWCRQHRPGFCAEKKEAAPAPDPEGWREWLAGKYPQAMAPKSFHNLPPDIRAEFEGRDA